MMKGQKQKVQSFQPLVREFIHPTHSQLIPTACLKVVETKEEVDTNGLVISIARYEKAR